MDAITEYQRIFPNHTPSCFQQDLMEHAVTDITTWQKALIFWAGNDYRPQSIQKLICYYDQLIEEQCNGKTRQYGKRTDEDVFRESADFYANYNDKPIA